MEFQPGEFRGERRNVAAQNDRGNRKAKILREALTGGQSFPRGSEKLSALVFSENQNLVRHNGGATGATATGTLLFAFGCGWCKRFTRAFLTLNFGAVSGFCVSGCFALPRLTALAGFSGLHCFL